VIDWIYFLIGLFIGGGVGVFVMSLMFAASRADDVMGDDQYK
jgi:hypothetical protein